MDSAFELLLNAKINQSSIKKQLKQLNNKYKINVDVNVKGANGIKGLNDSLKDVNDTVKKINETFDNPLNDSLKNVNNTAKKTNQTFGDIVSKVSKFYTATLPVHAFMNAINDAKTAIFEFDDALTEFKKVSDLSGDALINYTDKLGRMGEEVARTRTEMLESATAFKKTGSSEEDSAKLARIAELYKNIADTKVNSGEASSFLISQMKSFNFTADDTISIIDAMNNIANNMAVGTNDLEMALRKSGSALGTLGNSFNESIALVEAGTSIMQGQASKVGKGLK